MAETKKTTQTKTAQGKNSDDAKTAEAQASAAKAAEDKSSNAAKAAGDNKSASAAKAKAEDDAGPKIQIRSTRDPYRRAGLALGREPRVFDVKAISKEQAEALQADPNVFIEPVLED